MSGVRIGTALLSAALVVGACTSASSPTLVLSPAPVSSPSVTARPSATEPPTVTPAPTPSPGPTDFASTTYGYSLTLPAGWTAIQATEAWDGKGDASHDVPAADQFVGPGGLASWAVAAPSDRKLAGYVKERIAANAAQHGSTCPAEPDSQDPIEIGGEPAVLIAWNCGILINSGVTIHDGIAYLFGLRDRDVHASTNPSDRATFVELLHSVRYPTPFQSAHYGYVVDSLAWTGIDASIAWDGTGSPVDGDPTVDVLSGPGLRVFAYGAPTNATLDEFADALRATDAAATTHPCSAKPDTTTYVKVDGARARVDTVDCGLFLMSAYVVRDGFAYVFLRYDQPEREAEIRSAIGSLLKVLRFAP